MLFRLPLELSDEIVSRDGKLLGEYQKYQFQESAAMTMQYYGFLNTGKVFNDKRVRQAFCYAIDREKIVTHTVKGQGIAGVHGMAPPSFATYDTKAVKGYGFDANKARTLMAEAGFPEGKGFPELTLNINSGGGRNTQVAEAIQKMLQENLNIKVNISKMPFHQHLENTESAKFDFWRAGWVADYPDPENFLTLLWSDHLPKGDIAKGTTYLNTFRYKNAEFDRLFEEALKTVDEKKRNDLFRQADQIAVDDAAYMPLFYAKDQRLLQAKVKDFPQNAMEYRLLEKTYFAKK
jgi:peptide/nickel transport system substrate-binding protein